MRQVGERSRDPLVGEAGGEIGSVGDWDGWMELPLAVRMDGTVREGSSLTSVRRQGKEQWSEAVAVGRLKRTAGRHEDMMRSSGSWFGGR